MRLIRRPIRIGAVAVWTVALVVSTLSTWVTPSAIADAPPCRYSIGADDVLDNDTGLVWQHPIDAVPRTWSEADAYCASLSIGGTSGRLPTLRELHTLVDESRFNPSIDGSTFPGTPSASFWSSTPVASNAGLTWAVDFNVGLNWGSPVGDPLLVRCVR